MALAEREASIHWEGDIKRGGGQVTMESSGAFGQFDISLPTRTGNPEGHTSPEELLAASHAGCYASALSLVLSKGGTPPESLDAHAVAVLDKVGDGLAVTRIDLSVHGKVSGLDQSSFEDAARRAEQSCPISNALRGNVDINLEATLDQ